MNLVILELLVILVLLVILELLEILVLLVILELLEILAFRFSFISRATLAWRA